MMSVKASVAFLLLFETAYCQKQNPEERGHGFEGDIIIPESEEEMLENGEASAGIVGDHYRWPDATIPYEISGDYDADEARVIEDAMATISLYTCIRFVPHSREEHFIIFKNYAGCWSYVGLQMSGTVQNVSLEKGPNGCVHKGIVMHELMHAIGFYHEQSRPNRDEYVTVVKENIIEDNQHNFHKYSNSLDFGLPYDYRSLMHYGDASFATEAARKKGLKTLRPTKPGVQIGQRDHLSIYDVFKINEMYRCSESKSTIRTPQTDFLQVLYWLLKNPELKKPETPGLDPQAPKPVIQKLKISSDRRSSRPSLLQRTWGFENPKKVLRSQGKAKRSKSSF